MEQLAKLFDLQQLEQKIALIEEQMQQSDESQRKKRAEDAMALHEKQLARLEKNELSKRMALRALENQLAAAEAESEQIETRLFGGEVQNPKELAALQENLDATKQKKSELEESVLEEMERLETFNEKLEAARQLTLRLEEVLEVTSRRWAKAQSERETEVSQLKDEGERLRQQIGPTLLSQYDELRDRLGFRVVAQVKERRCSGCHMTLPTSMKTAVGDRCPNCNRLLWWE